jgi:phospholipid/cholesterol/gamma-HCH transport system permease protein
VHRDDQDKFSITRRGGAGAPAVLALSGGLVVGNINRLLVEIDHLFDEESPSSITVDMTELAHIDSVGALALIRMEKRARERVLPFTFEGMRREVKGIMDSIDDESLSMPPIHKEKTANSLFEGVGETSFIYYRDYVAIMTFLGDLVAALGFSLFHLRSVRWGDVIIYMKKAGAEALPIVGLISLLIGLIMAFMSSLQLKQFGANIYVASLVGIAIVKELGPMMTAIIVVGRARLLRPRLGP